ncbi:MAG: Bacterial SH3 domain protein [Deltaproteobacteria bacterium ADurb.Bin510]|nr:MAG: Bacterial SH3 domain protein [Deltaproteobacteria bacterium ADurb.Bin510]
MRKQGKFTLMDLAEFDAWLKVTSFSRVIKLVQNHHTYIPGYAHFKGDNHFALLNGMEASHIERGFTAIAQNLTSFPDGTVALCRPLDTIPAGIKGANAAGICIEHVGNFDAGGDEMSAKQRETIIGINALLCREFGLEPSTDTIIYHHWYDLVTGKRTDGTGTTKTCPGTAFFGGNTVKAAQENFIPLIAARLKPKPAAEASFKLAQVTATSLNVRSAPNASAKLVKSLQQGVEVKVYATENGWSRIHSSEQQWVCARYLSQ